MSPEHLTRLAVPAAARRTYPLRSGVRIVVVYSACLFLLCVGLGVIWAMLRAVFGIHDYPGRGIDADVAGKLAGTIIGSMIVYIRLARLYRSQYFAFAFPVAILTAIGSVLASAVMGGPIGASLIAFALAFQVTLVLLCRIISPSSSPNNRWSAP